MHNRILTTSYRFRQHFTPLKSFKKFNVNNPRFFSTNPRKKITNRDNIRIDPESSKLSK